MKILIVFLTVFFIAACANLSDSREKAQFFEEKFVGEHSALATCVANKLQSDAAYAPSNPDAILIYGNPVPEILSAAQRSENDKYVYAFALMLQKIDDTTLNASLKGDLFMGNIAWKILQSCAASAIKPLVP